MHIIALDTRRLMIYDISFLFFFEERNRKERKRTAIDLRLIMFYFK